MELTNSTTVLEALVSMRKARVKRLYSALDENEKEDIKALLN